MGNDWDLTNGGGKDKTPAEDAAGNDDITVVPLEDDGDKLNSGDESFINSKPNGINNKIEYVDVSSGGPAGSKGKVRSFFTEKFNPFWTKNNKRNLKRFITCLCVLIFLLLALAGAHIYSLLRTVPAPDNGLNFSNSNETFTTEENETDFVAMHDVKSASSLNDLLTKWANNGGEKLEDKNVVNVMLFGVDGTNGTSNGGSDTMLLISLNKETKKITIVSFMRDSYTYMNINGQDRFFKLNAAYNWGGPETVVQTIENNYKIVIDKYVCVDFTSFPKIIDSLGGVTVKVQPYEAKFIRSTSHFKHFPYGNAVKLSGAQALIFSRIRHLDSDNQRTRRQRLIIMAMINSAKTATDGQVNLAMKNILPNIRTNFTKGEILSLASQALIQKWADYKISQVLSPSDKTGKSAYVKTTYYSFPLFFWVVDYPVEARTVQLALYGKTNIILEKNRISAFDMLTPKTTSSSSSSTTKKSKTTTTAKSTSAASTTAATTEAATAAATTS